MSVCMLSLSLRQLLWLTVVVMAMAMQLMMPAESAHDTIGALGELGLLQFKDLNFEKSGFQRAFASQVKGVLANLHAGVLGLLVTAASQAGVQYEYLFFPAQVKRCDEMARKLRFFTQQVRPSRLP